MKTKTFFLISIILFATMFTLFSFYPSAVQATQTTFESTTSDGEVYNSGSPSDPYTTVRESITGTVSDSASSMKIGQEFVGGYGYQVKRSFPFFDTSTIPDNDEIVSAYLNVSLAADSSDTDFIIYIQDGESGYPHNPLVTQDFDLTKYSGIYGSRITNDLVVDEWFTIDITSAGLELIDKTGTTTFCLRSSRDVTPTTPTGYEHVSIYTSDYAGKEPQLVVTYQPQYYLTVSTDHSTQTGQGWYSQDATAYAGLVSGTVYDGSYKRYVFTHWSGNATGTNYAQSDPITMTDNMTAVANWKTQYYFTVNPPTIDSPTGATWYDDGTTDVYSTVTVPSDGYITTGWTGTGDLPSGGTIGSNETTHFTITQPTTCLWNWIEAQPVYITLETNPTGLQVRIDQGTWYNSPHEFEISNGTSHDIECNPIQSGGTRTQYIWQSWDDEGANPHEVTPTVNTTYTATYKTQYQVLLTSYPQGIGFVEFDDSPVTTPWTSGWYDSGTNRSVEATDKTITVNQERYAWDYWSDSGAKNHNVTIDAGQYTAYFDHEWYFNVESLFDSPTGEGWYIDGDTTVNSTVTTPVFENETTGWTGTGSLESGGTSGSNDTGTFTINEYSSCTWLWNVGPNFDSFGVSTTPIEAHEVFNVTVILSDPTGNTDFVNSTVDFDNFILEWINATDVLSVSYDPYSYVTLHDSSRTVLTSTSIELVWEISLGSNYPEGSVNVVQNNTKVYDGDGLVGSGSYSGLFVFQEEGGAVNPGGGSSGSVPEKLVEKVIAPSVFGITDNAIAVTILVVLALIAVVLYLKEYPAAAYVVGGGFIFLAVNFAVTYVMVPLELLPETLSFLRGFAAIFTPPALQLSTFTVAEQDLIQLLFMGGLFAVLISVVIMAAINQADT